MASYVLVRVILVLVGSHGIGPWQCLTCFGMSLMLRQAHGQVEILSQDGKTIRGQMIHGVLEGYAHWQDSNGVYAGHFKGGEVHGPVTTPAYHWVGVVSKILTSSPA